MKAKLAFVSLWNAAEPLAESGYAYSMRRQLQKRFEVVDVFPLALPGTGFWLPLRAACRLAGRYYHPMREPTVLIRLARGIERVLAAAKPDIVFAPSSVPMSFVQSRFPWVYATDQLFRDFIGTYIKRPSARFLRLGEAQEARALSRAARAAYPSESAAQTATGHYGADATKVSVIPWGANLPREIADVDVAAAIARRDPGQCRLVFLGRDWVRKGGDCFVATVNELRKLGLKAHGTVIGADPPGLPVRDFTVYPNLDKSQPRDFAIFSEVMANAHFLVAPARAEAYGQALCEAVAFGVPVIACAVGGIPTIVRNGETGVLLPPDAGHHVFAAHIRELMDSSTRYRCMAEAARDDYRSRLNWDCFGTRLAGVLEELV
jgi:glycosyltransferase involved in cell wall biosynthesis